MGKGKGSKLRMSMKLKKLSTFLEFMPINNYKLKKFCTKIKFIFPIKLLCK